MRVLVACEFSGIVRDAFLARGHDAISCDLLPTESPGPHVQGDVLPLLSERWDLVIAHPPCTYLTNMGSAANARDPSRVLRARPAAFFFRACLDANADRVAVENPVMHAMGRDLVGGYPSQKFQPWQFGDPFMKRVCLWLKGLPPLFPTSTYQGALTRVMARRGSPGLDSVSAPATDSEKAKVRSRFFPGVAAAMAHQWA